MLCLWKYIALARDLFLGAVSSFNQPLAGHSGDTPDSQTLIETSDTAGATETEAVECSGSGVEEKLSGREVEW